MTDSLPIVLITGVTGFVGAHVCKKFLESKNYKVRGTVRNPQSEKSLATLVEALGEDSFAKLELVPLELTNVDHFKSAVKDVTYVVHIASPFPKENPEDENLVIQPAVEGALNMLKAANEEPSVKRVCMTSSSYATILMDLEDKENYPELVDESCWSDETLPYVDPYQKSKILSEKKAWDYWKSLPEDSRYSFTTILPGYVMGPPLAKGMSGNSLGFTIDILTGKSTIFPHIGCPTVDVRDVAVAHYNSIERDEAQGKRFILASGTYRMADMASKIKDAVGDQYDISTKVMDEETGKKAVGPFWDFNPIHNTERSIKTLGLEYVPVSKTMADMANTLIDMEYVQDKRK